jgi:hypothetical protein
MEEDASALEAGNGTLEEQPSSGLSAWRRFPAMVVYGLGSPAESRTSRYQVRRAEAGLAPRPGQRPATACSRAVLSRARAMHKEHARLHT